MPHRSIAHIISQQTPVTAPASITVREACQRMAAARVGASPAAPTIAAMTVSTPGSAAICANESGPCST